MTKANENILQNLFGGDWQAYNANCARALGGIGCAVFAQYVLRWQRGGLDGWCFRTEAEIEQDTALTPKMLVRVREKLKETGILLEQRRGAPPRMYYRIDPDVVINMLSGDESNPTKGKDQTLPKVTFEGDQREGLIKEVTIKSPSNNPSPTGEGAKKAVRGLSELPEDWKLTDADIAYARDKLGWPEQKVWDEEERFYTYWRGSGGRKKDWHATWCNWCLNATIPRNGGKR